MANTGSYSSMRRWRNKWARFPARFSCSKAAIPSNSPQMAAHHREPVTAGRVCVDSGSLEEIEEVVIRDRRHLSEDGVVVAIIAIDKHTGQLESHAGNRHARLPASDDGQEIIAGSRAK